MATIEADGAPLLDLGDVRRIEAVGFRSFPAAMTHYDGTWAIRLTAGHPAKRLNSVTPLDPQDTAGMEKRIELAKQRFEGFGRQLVFRLSPLAPAALVTLLDAAGWKAFDESLVMVAPILPGAVAGAVDQVPLQDTGRWVDAWLRLCGETPDRKPGMVEVISGIKAQTGLFLVEDRGGNPVSAVRCVRDNDLAGFFEMETEAARRRLGHGRSVFGSAMKWAAAQGARTAWLQVEAKNEPARRLYESFGFAELYRYHYRLAPS
jgi:GNAT superfamily N-acetyltransferase